MRYAFCAWLCVSVLSAAPFTSATVTYHRDVLPVLQKNCQSCHRPGEAAPVSFLTYKETRPWAKAIREAVRTRKMPPWFADPHIGAFANDRSMSQADIDLVTRWVDAGAPEGNPENAPAPERFVEGWGIGKPDLIVEMPKEFDVPSNGTIEYTYFRVPTNFTEDKWIQMVEARPGNRAVVHHVVVFVREPGSKWMKDVPAGSPFVPSKANGDNGGGMGEFLVGYAPGAMPSIMRPGQAKLIKAGSDVVLQMHYTANGKSEKDRTRVGFVFAKEPPRERVMTLAVTTNKFVIPPGAGNHRVDASITLQQDSTLESFFPHMHLRGKAFEFRVVYPTGEKRELLRVPHYDFNWQLSYYPAKPVVLPKGSTLEATAWYDNRPIIRPTRILKRRFATATRVGKR